MFFQFEQSRPAENVRKTRSTTKRIDGTANMRTAIFLRWFLLFFTQTPMVRRFLFKTVRLTNARVFVGRPMRQRTILQRTAVVLRGRLLAKNVVFERLGRP
jgi:hypothetical protein